MTELFEADEGQTLLSDEDKKGLKPSWITFRADLNEAEQANIAKADRWLRKQKLAPLIFADTGLIRDIHKRMYGDVWKWAGTHRTEMTNIGVLPSHIGVELYKLVGDVDWWIKNNTYPPDELAVRFHHRLVWIHPFPNGNGRLSRMIADYVAISLGMKRFTWGENNLVDQGLTRAAYIQALQQADRQEIGLLLRFARS